MPETKLRFTAADRSAIAKQAIGKITPVTFEVNGVEVNLVPLSVSQGDEVFKLLKVFTDLRGKEGDQSAWGSIIATEGPRVTAILKDYLHASALATTEHEGLEWDEATFEEWFAGIPLISTLGAIFPKIIEAQSLDNKLGNSSAPTMVPTTP